jgi:hypothetical protein
MLVSLKHGAKGKGPTQFEMHAPEYGLRRELGVAG